MKGENIAIRLRALAAKVLRWSRACEDDPTAKHLVRQLVRSVTGGGANYEEARSAESRADFIHKVSVASKELRETLYWLQLAREAGLAGSEVDAFVSEANELVAILTASIRTAKENAARFPTQ